MCSIRAGYGPDALRRYERARRDGLSAAQAAKAVGVSRATLHRWSKRLEPKSRRPHRVRLKTWTSTLVREVEALRGDFPMWGKAKLGPLLRREGWTCSDATVGRILKRLMNQTGAPLRASEALHLAIARRTGHTLATFDSGMRRAAEDIGLPVEDLSPHP
jgi:hypothetical protein